jgi:hypothetical protein
MTVVALLSAAGVSRELLYAAGQQGLLDPADTGTAAAPQVVDEAPERLGGASLLTFGTEATT